MLGFRGETGGPGEKPLRARTRANNKLNPHMAPGPGVAPGTHWWEASALTTAPSLLPMVCNAGINVQTERGRGVRAKVGHLNASAVPSLGNFDFKFCPMLRTFKFDRAEDWVHLNLTMQSTRS